MQDSARQGKQTILLAIIVPMLVLLLAEVALLMGVLWNSGITARIDKNDAVTMDMQVQTRRDRLEDRLGVMSLQIESLASTINEYAVQLGQTEQLKLDRIDENAQDASKLLSAVVEPAISSLRSSNASGVFVVLNTQDLEAYREQGNYGGKQGIFIRDTSPTHAPSSRNDDLVFQCAAPSITHEHSITTASDWTPAFSMGKASYAAEHDYFYVPYQSARNATGNKTPERYGYWSVALLPGAEVGEVSVAYSLPLIAEDGSVYGVVGAEMSQTYLADLLPYQELIDLDEGAYMLARLDTQKTTIVPGDTLTIAPIMCVGFASIENAAYGHPFSIVRGTTSASSYHTVNGQYYITKEQLKLYKSNSPFLNQQWLILGIMPQSALHQFSAHVVRIMGSAALFMMLLGLIGSILVGLALSRPLRRLSAEVAQAELDGQEVIKLSSTGIVEVDQLTDAISTLSARVEKTRKLVQGRIEYERDYDLLTGLVNRRAFYRMGEEIFSNPEKLKEAAIVMLDLDNLKAYNDSFGHDCGDRYITAAALCFKSGVPDNVIVSRVSGDEFFLLFYAYDERSELEADIEQMWQTIQASEFVLPDGKTTCISASGGVALYLEDASEFTELMKLADFTMYQAKASGKNKIAYFDFDTYQRKATIHRAETEFSELMADFSLADYHFQPIFNAQNGKVFAYEALMRVQLGVLTNPLEVISLAHKNDCELMVERMTWIRSFECFEELKKRANLPANTRLFVNSFANLSLDKQELDELSRRFSNIVKNLVIEITENVEMDDAATETKRSMLDFSGFFALDDYGSGYNSERKLLNLRPKFVKVDAAIIRDIHRSADKQRIVSNIVEYAHERDVLIVAEGIESSQELDCLLRLHVDLFQGYYLAKPASRPAPLNIDALRQIKAFQASDVQA